MESKTHEYWMGLAIRQAKMAMAKDEVPVGAILICDGKIVSTAHNLREKLRSPLGHAEVLAIHRASKKLQSWRLLNCTLYVTLEPCLMCAGSIIQARIPKLVFAAKDPKGGAVESLYQTLSDSRLNHRVEILGGILENECGSLLRTFFKNKRK